MDAQGAKWSQYQKSESCIGQGSGLQKLSRNEMHDASFGAFCILKLLHLEQHSTGLFFPTSSHEINSILVQNLKATNYPSTISCTLLHATNLITRVFLLLAFFFLLQVANSTMSALARKVVKQCFIKWVASWWASVLFLVLSLPDHLENKERLLRPAAEGDEQEELWG